MPFGLIGKTVEVVREGGLWVVRYRGRVIAEHAVLAGRARPSVHNERGPGAAARNARQRYSEPSELPLTVPDVEAGREVEARDLAVYEQLFVHACEGRACSRPAARVRVPVERCEVVRPTA